MKRKLYRARYWRKDNIPAGGNLRSPTAIHALAECERNENSAPNLRGMTFSARNDAMAALFAYTTLQSYVDSIGGSTVWLEKA